MYKKDQYRQLSITDFNQPLGLKINPDNRWVKKAGIIPWDEIEDKYAKLFPSNTGMPAKPLRLALGSLMIQKRYGFSDRELVEELKENPYFQYFIGLKGYQDEAPFAPSLLVEFRKRLPDDVISEINELIIRHSNKGNNSGGSAATGESDSGDTPNEGTLILDATCAPQNIEYPQDVSLLNEARENLESIIDGMCLVYGLPKPRMYRKNARRDYLNLAKSKKRTQKKIRKAIKQQLQYIRRDRRYIEEFLAVGCDLSDKQAARLETIDRLVGQQQYMYDNKVHSVPNRIVSISQPYIRPIVRGKAAAPVEFGAKLDLSVDENGMARIEKLSYEAYNEADVLTQAVENYKSRTGHYPERVLADQIYRNRNNRSYCKELGIRLSGPALGRPRKDSKVDKKQEYIDNTDQIGVERAFALAKHCYGLGLITTKLDETTRHSIALSVLTMNVDRILAASLYLFAILEFSSYKVQKFAKNYVQKWQVLKMATY